MTTALTNKTRVTQSACKATVQDMARHRHTPTRHLAGKNTAPAPIQHHKPPPADIKFDQPQVADGLMLMRALPDATIPMTVFDPQYRGVLDHLRYGNEGKRQIRRSELPQMTDRTIADFLSEITRVLKPGGHLILWVDKYHLATGVGHWTGHHDLRTVDLITWDKQRIGMGYRTRRQAEYLLILQKLPQRARGVWKNHSIPDVWRETTSRRSHPHAKPAGLTAALIEAVTQAGDTILDPAAGSYSTLKACRRTGRRFVGADLIPWTHDMEKP